MIFALVLENRPLEEIGEVIGFCIEVGSPVTLKELGIKEVSYQDIMKVAEAAYVEGETIHNIDYNKFQGLN
ncbi:hypothetical protein [Wukongibacter sp. M2B1]|uniref:hypothetical protein n=1 Tax=Wukongibacter sp. M2B1 TaxID=3088895 RepID=UPI003D7ACCE3